MCQEEPVLAFCNCHHFVMRESTNLSPVISEGLNPFLIGIEFFDLQIFVPEFFNPVVEGSHF